MNLSIESQFNLIAREYDGNRRNFIPCFDDFYQNSTDFICKSIRPPKNILDLGAGTGLLSLFWYRHFPLADFYLVDLAAEMLNVARDRFAGSSTVHFAVMNYLEQFPKSSFDTVISALSIHHLEHADKQRLFDRIYEILPKGGLFVNYDQFCAGTELLNSWFDRYWINGLQHSALTPSDLKKWEQRRLLDRECSVEEEVSWLGKSGFSAVKCIYSCQKFAVIVALK